MMHKSLIVLAVSLSAVFLSASAAFATWSIVAVDNETGEVGVAVASCVGFEVSVVPVLVPGVGAGASQANISLPSGQRMADAIASGLSAQDTIDAVLAADDATEERQFGVVVLGDSGAGWTGGDTLDVALDERSRDGTASAQGNILASRDVVSDALEAFDAASGNLADRLVTALVAGADAGGDARCDEQTATAAALVVAQPGDDVYTHTADTPNGPDTSDESLPAVFVSVLVERGGDRAPDRLAAAWASAEDTSGSRPIAIREVDPGADIATSRSLSGATLVLGAVFLVGIAVAAWLIYTREKPSRD